MRMRGSDNSNLKNGRRCNILRGLSTNNNANLSNGMIYMSEYINSIKPQNDKGSQRREHIIAQIRRMARQSMYSAHNNVIGNCYCFVITSFAFL